MENRQLQGVSRAEVSWRIVYRAAGLGISAAVLMMLADMVLSFLGTDVETGGLSVLGWFELFRTNGLVGLRNLGLLNVLNLSLTIPLYLALFHLHRENSPAPAALALVLTLVGAAVYIANNRALSMLALSSQYFNAVTEAQRTLLETAGAVILSQAEDFTPGTFIGFFLSSLASLVMMIVILRGQVFKRWIGAVGFAGTGLLLVFTISVTFVPSTFEAAMLLALLGGLLMLAWNIAMALSMFRYGKTRVRQTSNPVTMAQAAQPAGE